MGVVQTTEPSASASPRSLDRLFEAAKKLPSSNCGGLQLSRVLCASLCSKQLADAGSNKCHPDLLSMQMPLYFVADDFFDSAYFYGPLLFFDTVILAISLTLAAAPLTDFYIACFFTIILSCICNDSRGLFLVTLLAPALYAYVAFNSAATHDSSVYLRLLFPLVISMFYGYFAQVERVKRLVKEKEEQARQQRSGRRDPGGNASGSRFFTRSTSQWLQPSSRQGFLNAFLEKALMHLPYAAAMVRLRHQETGLLETAASKNYDDRVATSINPLGLADEIFELDLW